MPEPLAPLRFPFSFAPSVGALCELSTGDEAFLIQATLLGRRGWGQVHPNPMVGCVLVRDGIVLGEGWHARFGEAHAEVEALSSARARGLDPAGATAYVSLEPCRHEGKTPPCTRALLNAGVTRVIYGAADPGLASGGGGDLLRRAGLDVVGPVYSLEAARRENPAFFPRAADRPWVILKLARTEDGWIAEAPGVRSLISGPEAGARVQALRAGVDGILVGGVTARVDDPLLTPRTVPAARVAPARILLDRTASLPHTLRLFQEGEGEVLLVQGAHAAEGRPVPGKASQLVLPEIEGRLPLPALMRELSRRGFRAILCEGGGVLAQALLEADLVDRLVLVTGTARGWAHGVPTFPDLAPDWVPSGPGWVEVDPSERLAGGDRWEVWDRTDEPVPELLERRG